MADVTERLTTPDTVGSTASTGGYYPQTTISHGQSVDEISKSLQRFNWPDYLVFVMMLLICICIGIFYGYQDHKKHKKRQTARRDSEALDYLVGGRKMKIFPVAVSLVASWISGISLLGTSTEIYIYGTQYCYIVFAIVMTGIAMHYIFLPVFHDLQITSAYEYLQLRFDKRMRLVGSLLFTIASILWLPIVIYVPALAFNQVSGVNIHIITPIVCLVCIFYTSIGGLKAVVWTDVIQTAIMVGAMIIVMIKGTMDVGGLGVLIERNSAGQRFEKPDFDLDPTSRQTFWNLFVGGTFFWTSTNAINQNMIQRYLSLPTLRAARKALICYLIGTTVVLSFCCYNGLLIYAMYHDCDPLSTGLAKAKDQLVPLLVMEVLAMYPGLAGLFVAGIFSAALSSLSTGLNALSAIVLEDFCKPFVKRPLTETQIRYLMRSTVLFFGALAVLLVVVVEKMGAVLQLSMSLGPVTLGPLFGLFVMGMFFPRIDGTSAIIGTIGGLATMSYIVIRSQISIAIGEIVFTEKPVTIEGCAYDFTRLNKTSAFPIDGSDSGTGKSLHHVSFLYYCMIGSMVPTIIGYISAVISRSIAINDEKERDIDPLLLAPFLRKYYQPKDVKNMKEVVHEFETKDIHFSISKFNLFFLFFQYLQLRFDSRIRMFGSGLFMMACLLWMPIVIYVPALAFNQVTGINIHTITPVVCVICIFYTSLGGMKAVVWTDVVQSSITFGALLVVLIKGIVNVGGFSVIIERNLATGRLELPNFDPDLTLRHTAWTMWIGGTVWYTYGTSCSQDMIQRYLSLPSLAAARAASRWFTFGMILVLSLMFSMGMVIFATYHDCDPLTTNLAKAKDQLVPLFVMDTFREYPGATGVFVAGIFSAALSSLSSALNALAAISFEDFCKPYFGSSLTEKQTGYILRGSVILFGVVSVLLIYIVEHLGAVMQLTMTLSSTAGGPLFGLFLMGVLMPWVTTTGALTGGIAGLLSMCYLCFRSQADMAAELIVYSTKQVNITGCTYEYVNSTSPEVTFEEMEKSLHHISYLYFTLFGASISCLVGSLVSLIKSGSTKKHFEQLDPQLLAPFIRKFLPDHTKTYGAVSVNSDKPTPESMPSNDLNQPE
ncbi:uncharacterized protein LOC129752995 [Uranotaenia lowii]|uniref:uncharacterized protein LOC129752995 n=1 Tax=Uranotaenia lowii TaxID=190385 RepID=UPI002478EC72|nr:uncharacterized protein LOC129752995 [Uranotaenia lowii]